MSKDKISDYSATANSNTDIAGINIDEGCAPSGINDAIRTLMKQLKDFQQGTNGDSFNGPHNGTVGATTPAAGTFTSVTTPIVGSASGASLALKTNGGTTAVTIDTAQNLGIGVTPSAWGGYKAAQIGAVGSIASSIAGQDVLLGSNSFFNGTNDRYIATGYASRYTQYGGWHYWYTAPSDTAGNAITFTQAMTLDASGNLGVGTTSPSARVESVSTTTTYSIIANNSNAAGVQNYIQFKSGVTSIGDINRPFGTNDVLANSNYGALVFGTGSAGTPTERMRIDSSGNLLVGTTNNAGNSGVGVKIQPSATSPLVAIVASDSTSASSSFQVYSTGAGAFRFYVDMGGTIHATSTSISAISDATLKTNVKDIETGLTEVMALKPRRFDWINGDATNVAGFIAQEVEQVLPELVSESLYSQDEEGNTVTKKNLKMGDILPTLVKAIQEQQAIIQQLQADVAALKG